MTLIIRHDARRSDTGRIVLELIKRALLAAAIYAAGFVFFLSVFAFLYVLLLAAEQ